jgi:hypothetical protein
LASEIRSGTRNCGIREKENYMWWRTIVPDGRQPSISRAGALEGGWSMAKKKAAKKKKR